MLHLYLGSPPHLSLSGPDDSYRLHVSGYNGTAGDALSGDGPVHSVTGHPVTFNSNNQQFTTRDRDHDSASGGNCAKIWGQY